MKIRYSSSILFLPLLFASCSADDSGIAEKAKSQVMRFTASVTETTSPDAAKTRAWADAYNSSLPANSTLYIFLYGYKGDGSASDDGIDLSVSQYESSRKWVYSTDGAVDVASGKSLLKQTSPTKDDLPASATDREDDDALPKFPSTLLDGAVKSTSYVDVFGVFLPPGSSTSPTVDNLTPASSSFTFSVSTTQTTEAAVKACDLLTNDVAATFSINSSAVNLEMKHRMAKVLVLFNPTEDLTETNMPDDTYSVENVQTTRTVTLKTGEVETSGSTSTITAKVGEPFFLPPQTIDAGTELFKFDLCNIGGTATGIKNVTFSPVSAMTFSEGVYYILTLNVGVRYINLTTTIKDWTGETILFDKVIL